jgi:putative endonuclease
MEDTQYQSQGEEQKNRLPTLSGRAAVGRAGEDVAANHLQQLGYRLEERNWRCRTGEIDLIAEDGAVLVYVEVRARTNPTRFGTAVEAVTPRKCRQVRELATLYMKQRKGPFQSIRFDVIAVTFLRDGTVAESKQLPGAF